MILKAPIRVILSLTDNCNLACQHCSAQEYSSTKQQLSTVEIISLLDELEQWGVMIIVLSGGEPLLHPDFFDIAKSAVEHGFKVFLTSNGTYITHEIAEKLNEIGIHDVQISIDGPSHTHNYIRGSREAFTDAVHAIKSCLLSGIHTSTMCTLSKLNLQYINEIIELCINLGVCACAFERMIPVGRGRNIKGSILTPLEFKHAISLLSQKRKVLGERMKIECSDPLTNPLSNKETAGSNDMLLGGCVAGIAACFISSTGTVYPCTRLPISLGNIRMTSLKAIWQTSETLELLRNRDNLSGKCGECVYRFTCGGCRAAAYAIHDNFLEEDPWCFI